MEIKELQALAAQVLNMPDADFTATFVETVDDKPAVKKDWATLFATQDAARIKKLKDDHAAELTKIHDKGHKKGTAEALDTWEASLKTEFAYEGDDKGIALIKAIAKQLSGGAGKDVKTSPEYLELEKKLAKTDKDWQKKMDDAVNAAQADYASKTMLQRAQETARKQLMELKPVLGANAAIGETRVKNYLAEFTGYKFQEVDGGGILILKADGTRLETANGHPVDFATFVNETAARHFEFETQPARGNAGNGKPPDNKPTPDTVSVPKNWGEVMQAVAKESDPEKVKSIYAAWDAAQAAPAAK